MASEFDKKVAELFPGLMPGGQVIAEAGFEESDAGIAVPRKHYDDEFDIVKLMAESKDPDTGLFRDMKIDDRDLAHGGSYYDFAFNIIGKDAHPPWMVQMWIGLMLFGEVCPRCSNKKWLDLDWFVEHVPKDKPSVDIKEGLEVLHHGKCSKCKTFKWELIEKHGLNNYTELVNVLGQRSGKSSSAAGYAAYHTHRMLKFPRLADLTTAMQRSTELTTTFVSLTYDKAFAVLWTPYRNIINESSWFDQLHEMLDYYGNKYGTELYRKKDEFIKYFHRGLKMYPTNPKSQTLRGDTRIMALIDELGLFPLPSGNDEEDETSDRANSDEAHKSLTNSLVTAQSIQIALLKEGKNCPPALMLGVSSPISVRDKVMRLLADSRTEEGRKQILGVNLPTWKVNPAIDRDSPFIKMKYALNAEKAERDFGANPPRVHQTFLKPGSVPFTLFKGKNTHVLQHRHDEPGFVYGKLVKVYTPRYPSVVTIDAGHTNNSFTLTAGHFDFAQQKTVISTVLECMAYDGRKIDFNRMYLEVILPVLRDVNAVALIADQWQSLDILSRARADMGKYMENGKEKDRCLTKQYSPRRFDFDALTTMMENGSIILPYIPEKDYRQVAAGEYIEFKTLREQPMKHLLLQMLTVVDGGHKKCPTKGPGFTDDIYRALVLQTLIHNPVVMERLQKANVAYVKEAVAMPKPGFVGRSLR